VADDESARSGRPSGTVGVSEDIWMAHDVVISYQALDTLAAVVIRDSLEAGGIICWMAPRDITAGAAWSSAIVEAIAQAKVVLLVGSANAFASRQVARELERADSKHKTIIPVMLEPTSLYGDFEYYLGRLQHFLAYPPPVDQHLEHLVITLRTLLAGAMPPSTVAMRPGTPTGDDVVALGRAISHDIREELCKLVVEGDAEVVAERRPGQTVNIIDVVCNRQARQTIGAWQRRGYTIRLVGEDIAEAVAPATGEDIVVCLDGLDGTQHWLRGRNLYCTAMSIFLKGGGGAHRLCASLVHHSNGMLFVAREDKCAAYIDGRPEPLRADTAGPLTLAEAHVCTVARRPGHYEALVPLLAGGSPFSGLYLFGGNPVLVELPLAHYDALFQPDATILDENHDLWDWLPGIHVAYRSGCTILDVHGNLADVPAIADDNFASGRSTFSYVAGRSAGLS
jgi:fructose-1,6-bisphosphatase/inositol monophosphatase family enzyme